MNIVEHFPHFADETHPNWDGIPDYMRGGLIRYVLHGISPGGFLSAVLSNDLREAVGRADETNQQALVHYVRFLYNYAPVGCWGSAKRFEEWPAEVRSET